MKKIPLLALLLLVGCLSYEENMVVHRNGSATISINVRIARQFRQQMGFDELFDREKIKNLLPAGAEIKTFNLNTERVLNILNLEVKIPDLELALASPPPEDDLFGQIEFSQDQNGNFLYRRSLKGMRKKFQESISRQKLDPRKERAIRSILARSYFKYRLETPLKIRESNADKIEEKALFWKVPVSRE